MYKNNYGRKKTTIQAKKVVIGVLGTCAIGGCIRFLSHLGNKDADVDTTTSITTGSDSVRADWYVGKKVSLAGMVESASDTLAYTHTLTITGSSEAIPVMSSTLDLSPYKGFMYIRANVAKFDGKKFILDIEAISANADTLGSLDLPTSSTSRIFPSLGIKLALDASSNMSYSMSGTTIIVQQANAANTITINGFRCETGMAGRDCDNLAGQGSGGSFVSAGGMTYYKLSSTERFARHAGGRGYRIQAESEAALYAISSVIVPLNDTYILSLMPQIKQLCGNPTTAAKPAITKEALTTWNIHYGSCYVRVAIDEAGEKLTLVSGGSTTPASGTISTGTTTNNSIPTNSLVPNTSTQAPAPTKSGFTYTNTNGGYSIVFPSAKIAYNGSMIQENLGVTDLLCYMRLDVKDYADKDKDEVGPAISIYECISKLSSSTLMSKLPGYYFQTNAAGTKLFFTKAHNDAWKSFAQKVKVE